MLALTVDHTFPALFSSIGLAIVAATLIVSLGKAISQYYFLVMMMAILAIIGTLLYIDIVRQRPQAKRGRFQHYVYSVYQAITEREVNEALYNIAEQHSRLLINGTPRNQSARLLGRLGGSNPNLTSLESPKLNKRLKK